MDDKYLIPANTKRGKLILSIFRPMDLTLFCTGLSVTGLLLAFLPLSSALVTGFVLAPALISAFLVMPVPYYHNMLNILIELYEFLTNRQTYRWKGWCYKDGKKKK